MFPVERLVRFGEPQCSTWNTTVRKGGVEFPCPLIPVKRIRTQKEQNHPMFHVEHSWDSIIWNDLITVSQAVLNVPRGTPDRPFSEMLTSPALWTFRPR